MESNKNTINITNKSQEVNPFPAGDHKAAMNRHEVEYVIYKMNANQDGHQNGCQDWCQNEVRKTAKSRKRYNQVPYLTQDTTMESNKNTINITNKSQEVNPFPAGDHKAAMNRHEVEYVIYKMNANQDGHQNGCQDGCQNDRCLLVHTCAHS